MQLLPRLMLLLLAFFPLGLMAQPELIVDSPDQAEDAYFTQVFGYTVCSPYNRVLYDSIDHWLGTPYCYSGTTENGIDCSGFTLKICKGVYDKDFPVRSSGELFQLCEKIDRNTLREGDLVFFKIYRGRISHVGIYLGENRFVHASTSKGVIISSLDEAYYKKYFAGAGRLPGS